MQHETSTSPNDIKIPVGDLRVGMFITRLDREWLGTPFLLQGFYVRSDEDIKQVVEYCKFVYVLSTGAPRFREPVDFESGTLIGRKPAQYPINVLFSEEFKVVKNLSLQARNYVKEMLSSVGRHDVVDMQGARKIVQSSVDSVIRHPDALTFVTRLRGEDEYTAEHCMNVCMLAIVFGRRLGLRKHQLVNLGLCGLLHDAGKARIPKGILNKPGRLSKEEFDIMKLHTTFGKEILSEKKDTYVEAINVAQSHHEQPDGLGYPGGLKSEELSLFTRIISIVDAYDAITGDRVYAKGRPTTEALRIIYTQKGKQFDHDLALAFIQTIGIYPPGMLVELIGGYVAIVVDRADAPSHLPNIVVLLDENKQECGNQFLSLQATIEDGRGRDFLIRRALPDGAYGIRMRKYYEEGLFEHMKLD